MRRFDAARLRAIHRHIFQDLPRLGVTDVMPGEYRQAVSQGKDWIKNRSLETVDTSSYVAYFKVRLAYNPSFSSVICPHFNREKMLV
ncbi:MAG: hypothetical protein LBF16_10480 [Pseudomonadales bacterium]|jgi:hypothetical protein|nr:hypothetical protein [Pseudomonadales bacterium]